MAAFSPALTSGFPAADYELTLAPLQAHLGGPTHTVVTGLVFGVRHNAETMQVRRELTLLSQTWELRFGKPGMQSIRSVGSSGMESQDDKLRRHTQWQQFLCASLPCVRRRWMACVPASGSWMPALR